MNNKILMLFVVFILISCFVGAAQTYTETIDNGGTIEINGHTINPEYIAGNGQVILRVDGSGELMVPGECVTRNLIKSCVDSADLDSVVVSLEFLGPEITIQKTFSNTNPIMNERVNVEVILQNSGDDSADNVVYTDAYPSDILVNPTSQNRVGNSVVWQGRIGKGKQEKLIYSIKPLKIGSFDVIAKAEYASQGSKYEATSDQTIEVTAPFNIVDELSKESPSRNEIIDYKITIENKADNYLDIKNLVFEVPFNVDIISVPQDFKISDKKATYLGKIGKNEAKEYVFKIKGTKVGEFIIKTHGIFSLTGTNYEADTSKKFGIGISNIVPIINLDPEELKSGSMYNIEIELKNRGKETINEVGVVVESDLFEKITQTKDIPAGLTIDIFKKELQAKDVEEETKYKINIKGAYTNADGKVLSFNEQKYLIVNPQEIIAEIIQNVKKEGNKYTFEVGVKNLKDSTVDSVSVSDIMPVELRGSLEGDITIDTTLEPHETKEAYSYSLEIPEDYEEDKFEIKTLFNGKLNGELYKLSKTQEIIINEEINNIQEDGQDEEIEEESNVEDSKKSFFDKILNFFKNLFSSSKENNKDNETEV